MIKYSYSTICLTFIVLLSCHKDDYEICRSRQFNKVYGGSNIEGAYSIVQVPDGGFVFTGWTSSNDQDVHGNHGSDDLWIVKLDCSARIQWQQSLGGSSGESGNAIIAGIDGGFVVAGTAYSNDGDVSNNHGGSDAWIVHLDRYGKMLWQVACGGSRNDFASSIIKAADGGYVFAGGVESNDGDVTGSHGNTDGWVVKIDQYGKKVWQKPLGGSTFDLIQKVVPSRDGGYICAGTTDSNDGDVSGHKGSGDAWIIKLDANGNIQWQKTYGGTQQDIFTSLISNPDGTITAAGITASSDGDISDKQGKSMEGAAWVIKLDQRGSIIWSTLFGGSKSDQARSIVRTASGDYLVVGSTNSQDGDISESIGNDDGWLLKLDGRGRLLWQKTIGGSAGESFFSIIANPDRSYAIAGTTSSTDHDIRSNHGSQDVWILATPDGGK